MDEGRNLFVPSPTRHSHGALCAWQEMQRLQERTEATITAGMYRLAQQQQQSLADLAARLAV